MVRNPAVAGQFYSGDKEQLLKDLADMIPDCRDKKDAIGAVAPHAGYIYSGAVAGAVYANMMPKSTYVLLSPNHTGYGRRFAFSAEPWQTPLGTVDVDTDLLDAMCHRTSLLAEDETAHISEHSIEVHLPFIQRISPGAKIVPITVQYGNISEFQEVADAIAGAVTETKRDVVIIASSDMTHYESREAASKKDHLAIRKILDLNAEGLFSVVEEKNISMCGYIPTVIMLMCAKKLKAEQAKLIKYTDSGEMTGDTMQVVGYAGIIVY